jgi:hypothetical protein
MARRSTSKRTVPSAASSAKSRSESIAVPSKRRNGRSPSAEPPNKKSKSKDVKEEDELETIRIRNSNPKSLLPTVTTPKKPVVWAKGTKRKLDQAQSATSSTNQTSSRHTEAELVEVDSDEGKTTRRNTEAVSKPPRKKRKVTAEAKRPLAQTPPTHQREEKHLDAGIQSPVTANLDDKSRNDESEVDAQNDGGEQQTKNNGKLAQEGGDDSGEVEVHQHQQPSPPNATPKVSKKLSKTGGPRMMPQPHSVWTVPSSNTQERHKAASAEKPISGSKAVDPKRSIATTKKSKESSTNRITPESNLPVESNSDSQLEFT